MVSTTADSVEPDAFGPLVRFYRKRAGLIQQELASQVGISAAYIGLIEQGQRGARLSRDTVRSLAAALELNVDESEALFRASGHYLFDGGVVQAIESDPALTDSSKRLMVNLYAKLSRSSH